MLEYDGSYGQMASPGFSLSFKKLCICTDFEDYNKKKNKKNSPSKFVLQVLTKWKKKSGQPKKREKKNHK